jgi:hypothetical protein
MELSYRSFNMVWIMKSRCLQWTGHVARIEETGNAYRIFMKKSLVEWPLRRKTRGKDDIKMDLKTVCCKDGKWMHVAQE